MAKVLIIDDDEDLAEMWMDSIEKRKIACEHVQNKNDALDALREQETPFNLILLDIEFTDSDYTGWEILSEIQKITDTKVMMVSVLNNVENRKLAKEHGIQFLLKPNDPRTLSADYLAEEVESVLNVKQAGLIVPINSCDPILYMQTELKLSPREKGFLKYLYEHRNQTVTYDEIIKNTEIALQADDYDYQPIKKIVNSTNGKTKAIDGRRIIENTRNVGYVLRSNT